LKKGHQRKVVTWYQRKNRALLKDQFIGQAFGKRELGGGEGGREEVDGVRKHPPYEMISVCHGISQRRRWDKGGGKGGHWVITWWGEDDERI